MIQTIKRMFATNRLVKEAEQVGEAIVKNPNDTCSYYLLGVSENSPARLVR